MKKHVVCLILGGGVGTRLFPLTAHRSKPAVPVAGKYRLIDIPISNCINSGITRMFVLTMFNSASLNNHIKHTYQFDLFSKGFVDIFAAEQTFSNKNWFQGTADAVRQVMPRMHDMDFDYVMILSGDQLYQMDFSGFLKTHRENKADLSIATIPVVASDASAFGIMKVDGSNMIRDFTEKPGPEELAKWVSDVPVKYADRGQVYLASMGIYIFNRGVLNELFEQYPDEHDFGRGIIPHCINNNYTVASHAYDGYWTDIGTIKSFFNANLALTDHIPLFNLFDNERVVYTHARMLSPSKIFGTSCDRALIADGCVIHAKELTHSVIGVRSRIGSGTVMRSVYNMGQDSYQDIEELVRVDKIPMGIGEDCHIEKAIIDRNCCIGNNVVITGHENLPDTENDLWCVKDGIVVIRKGSVIPHGTKIGV